MQKSIRSFAVAAVFALTITPAALANQTGCNPHPQQPPPPPPKPTFSFRSATLTYVYVALSVLGA